MCYKIINGLVAINCSEFFSFTDCDRTRGYNLELYIQICRLDVRKVSFARRVFPVLCGMLYHMINDSSVSSFKRTLEAVNLDLYTC